MTDQEMWKLFMSKEHLQDVKYEAWAFGGDPDGLAQLVLDGIKTGTASAYPLYELKNEPLPEAGSYSVILDSKDEAVCMIQTTKVYVVPFNQVSKEHAYKEGKATVPSVIGQEYTKIFSVPVCQKPVNHLKKICWLCARNLKLYSGNKCRLPAIRLNS
mgnify:CR=1 FL=1